MMKEQLLDFAEILSDYRVHIVREMLIRSIPEGATVFVCGEWIKWSSGKLERTKYHINGFSSEGEPRSWIIDGGKLLVKL